MKRLLFIALALSLTACSENPSDPTNSSKVDSLKLEHYSGKWLVVNYWAIWCKPCIKEIPELNSLNNLEQVQVLGVNYDGAIGEDLKQQIDKLGIEFPIVLQDPSAELGIDQPAVLPTSLVINPQGKLVDTLLGPQTLESLAIATGQPAPDASQTKH